MRKSNYDSFLIIGTIILLLSLCPYKTYPQFLNRDAVWTVRSETFGGVSEERYDDIQISKDSVIHGVNYSLFEYRNSLSAVREESNKFYYKVIEHNQSQDIYDTLEHVLYDFNLIKGDSILLNLPMNSDYYKNKWEVKEIDSIKIGNDFKKRIYLEIVPIHYGHGMYWIEDIGSSFGPIYFTGISEGEWEIELFCYRLNNEKLYGNCKHVGLNTYRKDDKISIQIKPSCRQVKVELPNEESCTLNIYSLSGTKMYTKIVPVNEYIDLTKIGNGLFLFEIKTSTQRHCKKIYIQ